MQKYNICECKIFCGPGYLCQGCTNLPAKHSNDEFDGGITGSESDNDSDGSLSHDSLAEEINTDDFNFEISHPACILTAYLI